MICGGVWACGYAGSNWMGGADMIGAHPLISRGAAPQVHERVRLKYWTNAVVGSRWHLQLALTIAAHRWNTPLECM